MRQDHGLHHWAKDGDIFVCADCGISYDDSQKAHARRTDPSTSHEAAEGIPSVKLTKARNAIFRIIQRNESTDEEIWDQLVRGGLSYLTSPSGARTRRSELVKIYDLVEDSGKRRKTRAGNNTIVWRVKRKKEEDR